MMGNGSIVHTDPEILGEIPVFAGTRVPLRNLFDYLKGGYTVPDFLDDFPGVSREQVIAVLDDARDVLGQRARTG